MLRQRSPWARLALVVCLALFVGIPVVLAQTEPSPEPVGQRPDAPLYALHGPYWVGTQTLELDTGTQDARRFTVWYPALNPQGLEESVTYTMSDNHILRFMLPPDVPFTVTGHALEGAPPDLSGAPYPLVVNSHGFTAQMWQMYLGEHLASYGFVVIAPEHAHDSYDNVYTSVVTRLFEVEQAIEDAENLTAVDGALAGMIDTDRVAVGGHSSGGMTALGAGGANMIWEGVVEYCQAVPEDAACVNLDAQLQQINELLGTDAAADELIPAVWDTRVDAIFPMSGSIELFGSQGLASVTVPMMMFFGSSDPLAAWMAPAYEAVSSEQASQVVFLDGGHGLFYNQCEAFPYLLDYDLYWACSDPVWDLARSQDLTNHFVTAFLLDVLEGDTQAHAELLPGAVDFPGIEYQTTMQ